MGTWDSAFGDRKRFTKADVEEARERLAGMLAPGDTVHTILEHVSRSGMFRRIRPVVLREGDAVNLGFSTAAVIGESVTDQAVHMSGCGMDMGFALVYELSQRLFPDGFECIGDRCPSNDHSNGDHNHEPHHHNSGGYALRQRRL